MVSLTGSITEEDRAFVETWESVSDAQNYIIRQNRRGDDAPELIQGHREFKITTFERITTEDKILDKRHNPFTNGCFRPIIVPQAITLEGNPNALSDTDIDRVFLASEAAWEAYMEVIDAPATLRRMLDRAESSTISLKRYREIQQRELEMNPTKRIVQKDNDQYEKLGGSGPQGGAPTAGGSETVRGARRTGATITRANA